MTIGGETRVMLHIPEGSIRPVRISLTKKTICSGIVINIVELFTGNEKNQNNIALCMGLQMLMYRDYPGYFPRCGIGRKPTTLKYPDPDIQLNSIQLQ